MSMNPREVSLGRTITISLQTWERIAAWNGSFEDNLSARVEALLIYALNNKRVPNIQRQMINRTKKKE